MTQRELLSVRLCDLNVSIEGTWLEEQIERVRDELAQRDLRFNPHFWLSDEWFSPTGVPGVALPFYLAHPKLIASARNVAGGWRLLGAGLSHGVARRAV
jgi:hypothetical protein